MPKKIRCRLCGKKCDTVYCDECAKLVLCPHGNKLGTCNQCDVESDLAYDSCREGHR